MTAFSITANSARIPGGLGSAPVAAPFMVAGAVWQPGDESSSSGCPIGAALALEYQADAMSALARLGACEACGHVLSVDDCDCSPDPMCVCGQVAS